MYSRTQVISYLDRANSFFQKKINKCISVTELNDLCNSAYKDFIKYMNKSIDSGKISYNSALEKARNTWFNLETILKVAKIYNLKEIDNFSKFLNEETILKFTDHLNNELKGLYSSILEK